MAFFGSSDTSLNIVLRLKDEATAALKNVESKLEHFNKRLEPAIGASQKFALAMGGAGAALGAFGVSAIKAAANAEQTLIAFETMLGSAENAKKFYSELVQFAAKTPFELTGLEQASKQLLAYGFAQEEVLPNLRALGDIASGVGMDKLPNLILAYGQVRAATKLTGMELRQFTEAGVPLLEELSNVMGKPVSAIQEMVSAGEIGFPIVQQALQNLTGEGGRFNDLMDKQSKSLGGMWSNLKDAWEQFLREQGAQLIEWAKQFVVVLIDIVENHLPKWIAMIQQIITWFQEHKTAIFIVVGAIMGALIPSIYAAAIAFGALAISLAPFIIGGAIVGGLVAGIIWVIKNWESLKATAMEVWEAIKTVIVDNINHILFFIGPAGWLLLGIKLLIEHWGALSAKTSEFWASIKYAVGEAVDWITAKIKPFLSVINTVKGAVSSVGSFVGSAVSSVANVLKPVFGPVRPRASGGPVHAGQPYMVGEQGPELFLPRSNGSIVPNQSLQSRPIIMNFHFNDAVAGDDGIRRIIQSTIEQLNRQSALRAIAGT